MTTLKKFIAVAALLFAFNALTAQPPPPPNGNSNPGGNTPVGGGAPIGSGVALLIALGGAYGGKKFYDFKKEKAKD